MLGVVLTLRQASATYTGQSPYDLADGRDALGTGFTHAMYTLRGCVEMTACEARGRAPRRGGSNCHAKPAKTKPT
jgi:hypothetical protein